MFKYIWYPKTFNNFRKSGVTGYVWTYPKSHFFLSWMFSLYKISKRSLPANIYLFKVNRTNIRTRYEICLKQCRNQNDLNDVILVSFGVNFEYISYVLLVFWPWVRKCLVNNCFWRYCWSVDTAIWLTENSLGNILKKKNILTADLAK